MGNNLQISLFLISCPASKFHQCHGFTFFLLSSGQYTLRVIFFLFIYFSCCCCFLSVSYNQLHKTYDICLFWTWLISISLLICSCLYVIVKGSCSFYGFVVFHQVDVPHFLYPVISSGLMSYVSCYGLSHYK